MSYDTKCHDLAEYFLQDCDWELKDDASRLAQVIQDSIEDYLREREDEEARKLSFSR
jgi:hypothetical protein